MGRFQDIPIRRKLTLISLLTSGVALLLACAMLAGYEVVMFRRGMVRGLTTLAEIVGTNSTAALLFNDQQAAGETLAALMAEPRILSACIYAKDKRVFARYARSSGADGFCPSAPGAEGYFFGSGRLELSRPIAFDNERVGTVYLRSDLEELYDLLLRYGAIVLLVLVVASLAAFIISSRLQRVISGPILRLVELAGRVSKERNDPVRAVKESKDELGLLNGMLTEIQRQDEALRLAHDELLQRTTQLEAANRELEAFSYSVSHDLRAPLRAIDGFTQVVLEDHGASLEDEAKNYLGRVRAASQRMGQLIDDLLNLSRVTRGEMRREEVDLSAIVLTTIQDLQRTSPERRVRMKVTEGLSAKGDPGLLRVALENLLGNAWKFTSRNEGATIEFGSVQSSGKTIYFVRDNGVGFDPEYSDKLFGAFQRLHGRDEFEGTGIGLATVQRIIQRHGGRVWAEGQVDVGATFYFALGQGLQI
jgi:signal transduction histidine kinase